LQNGLVASVSNSVVRTTHLTGLFTDLAMELSLLLRPAGRKDARLRFRFTLHSAILAGYLVGGVLGGLLCSRWGFSALYFSCCILLGVLARDLTLLRLGVDRHSERASTHPTV
ncbi:MAG TPA: DUF1275 family protein, partial [Polyangiales bacterium]